jgi:hypothetical protein
MFRFLSSRAGLLQLSVGVIAIALILIWPLTPALSSTDQRLARSVGVLIAAVASGAIALLGRSLRPIVWTAIAIVSGLAALAALYAHFDAGQRCVADYNGQPTIIGREFTPEGQRVVASNPRVSPSELLLWAGGQVDVVWTEASIAGCRFWVSWGGLLALPLFGVCVGSLVARRGAHLWSGGPAAAAATNVDASRPVRYDAFISYRRLDRTKAEALAEAIESRGFRVAIDFRDFRPNETVLAEMERCIIESRFVLCVITPDYASSGFTNEEALMAKLLDLTERRNRIVPLVFEHVPMPAWLQGLVGINFTAAAQIDPIEKLLMLLSQREKG